MFCFQMMNIRVPSKIQYHRVQNLLVTPVVEECWRLEQEQIVKTMKEKHLRGICAADGQFDSPGFCVRLLVFFYFLDKRTNALYYLGHVPYIRADVGGVGT